MSRPILGDSPAVKDLIQMIKRVAGSKTNVLIIGESGTGKELAARMIHELSSNKTQPFVPVNCGAIPENLIESEMFGHLKGSFTGAVSDKEGLFQTAHKGTLFLDEVGELSMTMQVKLLRVIQERSFRKVGGIEDIRVDVRIIAATNRDLEAAVKKGTFREDLYYRLNVIQIKTPPLRERKGDVRVLAEKFLEKFSTKSHKSIRGFDAEAMLALENYAWPGNIRELENCIERAVTLEGGDTVSLGALPQVLQDKAKTRASLQEVPQAAASEIRLPAPNFSKGKINLDQVLGDVEKIYLNAALEHAGGVKKKAADLLGITFRSMRYRLSKLGIDHSDDDSE